MQAHIGQTNVNPPENEIELLTHPPYSPDLAASDFYLFARLKSDLQSMQFADNAVIHTVPEWTRRHPQAFFENSIRMLPDRWKKCVDSVGEYVEV
jgi:histone-lysine N-methyltransferase SETMAR